MVSVVVCDDSALARKQVAKSLPQEWQVAVHFAKHGEEALSLIEQGKADLLLLDLNMPVMDGYQTLQAIQSKDYQVNVIVISGDIQPEAHRRVHDLGALDFITKPVNPSVMRETLIKHGLIQAAPVVSTEMLLPEVRDIYQEVANIAMGRAGDRLARIMDVFVELPIPNVNLIDASELHMMLSDANAQEQVTAVCQGFIGPGVSGEALCILTDSSFSEVASILGISGPVDDQLQLEMLMDLASILIGTCLTGLGGQMDLKFSQGHPTLLGQHRSIDDLIAINKVKWNQTLAIEISYGLEGYKVHCDMILLFTEASLKTMNSKLAYLMEGE